MVVMNVTIAENSFLREDRHKRHIENCVGVPGVVYNFITKK